MTRRAIDVDVSELPDFAFGHRDTSWWGTLVFMLVEGTTLAVCLASYFYLRRNFADWPPPRDPLPAVWPTLVCWALALASLYPAQKAKEAAMEHDEGATTRWLVLTAALGVALVAVRFVQFGHLGTRWDEHAYGSIVWMTMGLKFTIILTDVADTLVLTAIFLTGRAEDKHYVATDDNALYLKFTAVVIFVVDAVIVLSPRVI